MTEIISLNTKPKVPDHLTESNIFCRYASNNIVEVTPKELHFVGFKLSQKNIKEIQFTNISDEISQFHIIPPVSKYFKLRYEKPARLVPGFYIKCEVLFTPDKPRIYNDFIKIHTKDSKNNIVVPIYAYPAIEGLDVPRNIKFPVTPIGYKCLKFLKLHSDSDYEFDFEIVVTKDNPSITVEPLSGKIPAKGDRQVRLQFYPTDYITCEKSIDIYVNQYNFKPISCTLSGSSEPGMKRKPVSETAVSKELVSIEKLEGKGRTTKSRSLLLSQNSKSAVSSALAVNPQDKYKQLKTDFEARVRENVAKEKQNQLKWQTYLGGTAPDQADEEEILRQREQAISEYALRIRTKDKLKEAYLNNYVEPSGWTRTIRTDCDSERIDFDKVKNVGLVSECWSLRKQHLERFRQAVSRVIVARRLRTRLKLLLASEGRFIEVDNSHMNPGGDELILSRTMGLAGINGDDMKNFPISKVKLHDNVDWNLSELTLKAPMTPKFEYWSLMVPHEAQVLGYDRVDTSLLAYRSQNAPYQPKNPPVAETTIASSQQPTIKPDIYTVNKEIISGLNQDQDESLHLYSRGTTYCDDPLLLPLYFYQDEKLAPKTEWPPPQAENGVSWRKYRSQVLTAKKLIKSSVDDRLIQESRTSNVLEGALIPDMMTEKDMNNMDYDEKSVENISINMKMILDEYPVLNSVKETIDCEWTL